MQTARLVSETRTVDNQFGAGEQIAQFNQVGCDLVLLVVIVDLGFEHFDAFFCKF